MENKRGNVAVIVIIIVIVAITAGVIGFLFAKKSQAPAQQALVTQPIPKAQQKVTVSEPQLSYKTTAQLEASISEDLKYVKIDKKFLPSWFINGGENELSGKRDGGGYPIYTNERLCFQITVPSYLKEDYDSIVSLKSMIEFSENEGMTDKLSQRSLFSIGRMSNEEYVYYSTIESRGGFADSKVIGNSDKYVYLLQDTTGPRGDKPDFATAENLKFRIIDCK